MASGSVVGAAVTLATTGTTGGRIATAASASAIASAAGCISGEWNGAETFSAMARLMPMLLAISGALSTAALVPEITTWPGALSLATTQTPPAAAAHSLASSSA